MENHEGSHGLKFEKPWFSVSAGQVFWYLDRNRTTSGDPCLLVWIPPTCLCLAHAPSSPLPTLSHAQQKGVGLACLDPQSFILSRVGSVSGGSVGEGFQASGRTGEGLGETRGLQSMVCLSPASEEQWAVLGPKAQTRGAAWTHSTAHHLLGSVPSGAGDFPSLRLCFLVCNVEIIIAPTLSGYCGE